MTRRFGRVLLLLAVIGVAVFAAGWWALDRWLESAGGRGAVERSLGEVLGFPVQLGGEFGVRLLPSIGVGGTELLAGEELAAPETAFLRGRGYAVELALGPLWRGEMRLESIRLDGGHIDLSRLPDAKAAEPASRAGTPAWTVREFVVTDVEVRGLSAAPLRVASLQVDDLEPGADAPFDLRVDELGRLQGHFRWEPAVAAVSLVAAWTGAVPGRVDLEWRAAIDDRSGALSAAWRHAPADAEPGGRLSLEYAGLEGGFRIPALRAEFPGQAVDGEGCLLTVDGTSLNLQLEAVALDLDALPAWPGAGVDSVTGSGTDAAIAWVEESVRLRLRVGELRSGELEARGAELGLGPEPDCSGLAPLGGMRHAVEPLQ